MDNIVYIIHGCMYRKNEQGGGSWREQCSVELGRQLACSVPERVFNILWFNRLLVQ